MEPLGELGGVVGADAQPDGATVLALQYLDGTGVKLGGDMQ